MLRKAGHDNAAEGVGRNSDGINQFRLQQKAV
jgi:hypothetical protein